VAGRNCKRQSGGVVGSTACVLVETDGGRGVVNGLFVVLSIGGG